MKHQIVLKNEAFFKDYIRIVHIPNLENTWFKWSCFFQTFNTLYKQSDVDSALISKWHFDLWFCTFQMLSCKEYLAVSIAFFFVARIVRPIVLYLRQLIRANTAFLFLGGKGFSIQPFAPPSFFVHDTMKQVMKECPSCTVAPTERGHWNNPVSSSVCTAAGPFPATLTVALYRQLLVSVGALIQRRNEGIKMN